MPTELFSNGGTTTLAADITDTATSLTVASATGFPTGTGQYRIRVGDELMIVTGGLGTTTWTVTRAAEGTAAAAHVSGARVNHYLTAGALANKVLDDLTDVDLATAPTNGQALVFGAGVWKPGAAGATTLDALTDVDTSTTAPTDGQALVFGAGAWKPGTVASGGGGSSGSGGTRYWRRDNADLSSGTVPTAATVLAPLTITIPSSTTARTAFVSYRVSWTGGHTNRMDVYLNGVAQVATVVGVTSSTSNPYVADLANFPILLPANVEHTIDVRINAVDSTAAVTWTERMLSVDVYDGETTTTSLGGGGGGGGGSSAWTKAIDLPLTSLTNWTVSGGTWTAEVDRIRQASTAAATNRLIYTGSLMRARLYAEVEVRIDSNPSGDAWAGLVFGTDTAATIGGPAAFIRAASAATSSTLAYFEAEGHTAYGTPTLPTAVPHGTWAKLGFELADGAITFLVNDVVVSTARSLSLAGIRTHLALVSRTSDVSFRNLKVWEPTAPALVGSGGSGTTWSADSPDKPPATRSTYDDEFDGSTAPTWTAFGSPAVDVVHTNRPGHLHLRSAGTGSMLVGRVQAAPTTFPFTVKAKLASSTFRQNFQRGGGLCFFPAGAISLTSTPRYWGVVYDSGYKTSLITYADLDSFSSQVIGIPPSAPRGPFYFRAVFASATSVTCAWSEDGWAWYELAAQTLPWDIGQIGLACSEEATGGLDAYFDWFRVS